MELNMIKKLMEQTGKVPFLARLLALLVAGTTIAALIAAPDFCTHPNPNDVLNEIISLSGMNSAYLAEMR